MAAVSGAQSGAEFHRSSLKTFNAQDGFNMLETWVRTNELNKDNLEGLYLFISQFNPEEDRAVFATSTSFDLNALLGDIKTHIEENNKAKIQEALIKLANAQYTISQVYFGQKIRALCERMQQESDYSDVDKGTLLAMVHFLKADLFKSDKDIPMLCARMQESIEANSADDIRGVLGDFIVRFKEGWGGFLGRQIPLVGRLWT